MGQVGGSCALCRGQEGRGLLLQGADAGHAKPARACDQAHHKFDHSEGIESTQGAAIRPMQASVKVPCPKLGHAYYLNRSLVSLQHLNAELLRHLCALTLFVFKVSLALLSESFSWGSLSGQIRVDSGLQQAGQSGAGQGPV